MIQGTEKDFMFWVFNFPLIASKIPGYVLIPSIRQMLILVALFILFLPIIVRKSHTFFLAVAAVLVLFAYPRFDYFHLIPSLAVISLIFGVNISYFAGSDVLRRIVFLITVIFLGLFTLRYFQSHWQKEIRFFESEIFTAARFLSIVVSRNETVYIQNGPDQLLPLSGHLPPKPWADEFPWYLETRGVQEKVIEGIKTADTKFAVFQSYLSEGTYDLGSYKPAKVANFIDENFHNLIPINNSLWLKIKK